MAARIGLLRVPLHNFIQICPKQHVVQRTLFTISPHFNCARIPLHGDIVEHDKKSPEDAIQTVEILQKINKQIKKEDHGRLFAVVQVASHQYKVTTEDIIVVLKHMELDVGDRIRLDKVLMVGSSDFTIIGRPLISKDLIRVEATALERTFSHLKSRFIFLKRRRFQRLKLLKTSYTYLRINSIDFVGLVNETPQVEGIKDTIF